MVQNVPSGGSMLAAIWLKAGGDPLAHSSWRSEPQLDQYSWRFTRGLVWDDIDLDGATVHLHRALNFSLASSVTGSSRKREWVYAPVKTHASAATMDLATDVVEALRAHQARQEAWLASTGAQTEWTELGLVFTTSAGNPLHQSNIGSTLHKHLAECGLPRTTLHALRHSYAALMVAADVNPKSIQQAMRHASIKTTLDTYGHLIKAKQIERLERVSGVMDSARERAAKTASEPGSVTDRIFRSSD